MSVSNGLAYFVEAEMKLRKFFVKLSPTVTRPKNATCRLQKATIAFLAASHFVDRHFVHRHLFCKHFVYDECTVGEFKCSSDCVKFVMFVWAW
jgi:hypothetical protein